MSLYCTKLHILIGLLCGCDSKMFDDWCCMWYHRQQLRRSVAELVCLVRMRARRVCRTQDGNLTTSVALNRQRLCAALASLHVLNPHIKARSLNTCRLMERLRQWFVNQNTRHNTTYDKSLTYKMVLA